MRLIHYTLIGLPLLIFSCSYEQPISNADSQEVTLNGKELMEKNCYVCHNTQGTDNMLAPPMSRVRDHYIDDETTQKEFVDAIVSWCENPNEEDSRMPGARRKFGLMPKQEFNSKEVESIAEFLFKKDSEMSDCSH